jgi:hypothetical protein
VGLGGLLSPEPLSSAGSSLSSGSPSKPKARDVILRLFVLEFQRGGLALTGTCRTLLGASLGMLGG